MICRSNSSICAFSVRSCSPRASTHALALSAIVRLLYQRLHLAAVQLLYVRPARLSQTRQDARIALITAVCCRINSCLVRCSTMPLCCSFVLLSSYLIFSLLSSSQISSSSSSSFFCLLSYLFTYAFFIILTLCPSSAVAVTNVAMSRTPLYQLGTLSSFQRSQHVASLQLPSYDHLSIRIYALHLKTDFAISRPFVLIASMFLSSQSGFLFISILFKSGHRLGVTVASKHASFEI